MLTIMNKQMLYVMPIITIIIGMSFPAGLTFYWFLTTLFTVIQQIVVFKSVNKKEKENIVKVVN